LALTPSVKRALRRRFRASQIPVTCAACLLLLGLRAYELAETSKGNGEKCLLAFELLISTARKGRNEYYSRLIGIWVATGHSFITGGGDAAVPVAQSCDKPTLFAFL